MMTKIEVVIRQCLSLLNRGAVQLQAPFLLLVRLYWGWQFAETGWGKVNNIGKVTGYFTTLGIPFPAINAHFIAGLELVGGILLILGLASRPVALMLTVNMLVAYIAADREALTSFLSDPDKFIAATPFPFLLASLIVSVFGAGAFSVDDWIVTYTGLNQSNQKRQAAAPAA